MDFDPFCLFVFQGSLLVILIMIDSCEKLPFAKTAFELQSSRVKSQKNYMELINNNLKFMSS